jgi:hypothetical protein
MAMRYATHNSQSLIPLVSQMNQFIPPLYILYLFQYYPPTYTLVSGMFSSFQVDRTSVACIVSCALRALHISSSLIRTRGQTMANAISCGIPPPRQQTNNRQPHDLVQRLPAPLQHYLVRFVVLTSSAYLLTAGVEVVYFHLITMRHTTVGRTPLDEGSARRRDLYLTTQTLTQDKHPCPRWDSNTLSQQAPGRRPTP